jgi:hypothetical protein
LAEWQPAYVFAMAISTIGVQFVLTAYYSLTTIHHSPFTIYHLMLRSQRLMIALDAFFVPEAH